MTVMTPTPDDADYRVCNDLDRKGYWLSSKTSYSVESRESCISCARLTRLSMNGSLMITISMVLSRNLYDRSDGLSTCTP